MELLTLSVQTTGRIAQPTFPIMEQLRTELTSMQHNKRSFFVFHQLACFCIAVFLLSPSVLRAQTNAEKTVQITMKEVEQEGVNGVMEKSLSRLGDASAVAITKLLADKPLVETDIRNILLVVKLSYDSPLSVEDATEREPRTTLYLLHSLSQATKDPKILTSIEETTAYVKNQYATYVKTHPNE